MRSVSLLALGCWLLLGSPPARAEGRPEATFERDVLPVLKARCFSCHGTQKQKAGLRLDVRSATLKGGESGRAAVVPGKSDASELVRRVLSDEQDVKMPPDGARLTQDQVAALRAWIDAGAKWPDALANEVAARKHWAFSTPVRPTLPPFRKAGWVRTPVDAFVLARLEKEGLAPSPEADKVTLCRRLYLDLLGLPPTPQQVEAFLRDESPNAYEKLVEQLLKSPHYGERWGRLWLDAARYADSDGFEKDKPRFVWFYRDWVLNAFNRDLPYNQFLVEQVAGDLLPGATQDQRVATGFLRNSMINEEGGIDPEQFRMEAMFDRMDAVGKGVLGLTIQCAQCHTHKYDPLTQVEYYRLFAYLNNAHEANVTVYTPEEQMRRADLFRQIRELEEDLQHKTPDWRQRLAAWEVGVRRGRPDWEVVRPELDASGGQKHHLLDDGSILALGYAPTKHTTDFTAKTERKKIAAVRLELLNDPNLPRGGPGRSIYGLFGLSEFKVQAAPADKPSERKDVKIARATANANPAERPLEAAFDDKTNKKRVTGPVAYAIDGKDETAWTIDVGPGRSNVPRQAVFVFEKPVEFESGAVLTFKLVQNHGGWNSDDNQNNNLGRFRFAVTDVADAAADPLSARAREALAVAPEKRTPAQVAELFSAWRAAVPEFQEVNDKIEQLWKNHPAGASQLTLQERVAPRGTSVLKRGSFLQPGDAVKPGVPEFLHPLPADAPAGRLGLARWLTDPRSPTTARSWVNRVWQAYFGTGLVATSEDFGTQGDLPSHPELLDWLAVEFMERGWSVKALHRTVVTSAAYRQSSRVTPELLAADPGNRLIARGPRLRVDAEVVRDIALSASGLLNPRVGGPSVYPPLPGFLMLPPASYGPKVWKEDQGPDRYRRALYTFRFRSVPYPALQAFDAPNGDFSCVKRTRSNTPLQALVALNEPVFVECAQALALRVLREGGADDTARAAYAFRLCIARAPSTPELKELLALLEKQKSQFAAPGSKPEAVAFAKPEDAKKLPDAVRPADAAAWTVVARALLNLDETITKE